MSYIIKSNAEKDPNYAPYCGRCRGLHRMTKVAYLYWTHHCGAIHDEREKIDNTPPEVK